MTEFAIFEVITMKEASHMWGVSPRAIQLRLMRQDNHNDGVQFLRKSGGTWLTTVSAMTQVYGSPVAPRRDYES